MREFNLQKRDYEGKYLRPFGDRFQTIIHVTDIHDQNCDPFFRRVLIDAIKRIQPAKVIFGGDLFDLPEFGKYQVDPRSWDVVGRIRWVHAFLEEARHAAPNAEFVLTEGNHEYRLLRHLSEATPAMRAVLSDLHGFTVPKLLGLDKYAVNYVSRSDLATFTRNDIKAEVSRNYYVAYDCYVAHHFPEGERLGLPGAHGHHHQHSVNQHFNPLLGAYEWHQLGCGHRRQADYCDGERWGMGFAIVHVDTQRKHVVHEYVQVRDYAVVGGVHYTRAPEEV
jgi:hypothetical protein